MDGWIDDLIELHTLHIRIRVRYHELHGARVSVTRAKAGRIWWAFANSWRWSGSGWNWWFLNKSSVGDSAVPTALIVPPMVRGFLRIDILMTLHFLHSVWWCGGYLRPQGRILVHPPCLLQSSLRMLVPCDHHSLVVWVGHHITDSFQVQQSFLDLLLTCGTTHGHHQLECGDWGSPAAIHCRPCLCAFRSI